MLAILMALLLGLGGLPQLEAQNLCEDFLKTVFIGAASQSSRDIQFKVSPNWGGIRNGEDEFVARRDVQPHLRQVRLASGNDGVLAAMGLGAFVPPSTDLGSRPANIYDARGKRIEVRHLAIDDLGNLLPGCVGNIEGRIFSSNEGVMAIGRRIGAAPGFIGGIAGKKGCEACEESSESANYQAPYREGVGPHSGIRGVPRRLGSYPLWVRILIAGCALSLANFLFVRFANWSLEERNFRLGGYLLLPVIGSGGGLLMLILWSLFGA